MRKLVGDRSQRKPIKQACYYMAPVNSARELVAPPDGEEFAIAALNRTKDEATRYFLYKDGAWSSEPIEIVGRPL
jgi:hypothetical protein